MMSPARLLFVLLLLSQAVFWGLFSHRAHCAAAAALGVAECPSHLLHLAAGVAFFVAAVAVAHWDYLRGARAGAKGI